MENIIRNLMDKNWLAITKAIENGQIEWDYLVDQTNGTLHYLAYHGKIDLIKLIDKNIFLNIIGQPNIEGDTIYHIASKMNDTKLLKFILKTNPIFIYQKNQLEYTPLFYLVQNDTLIREIVGEIEIIDHYLNKEYTLVEYYILSKNLDMVNFLLDNISINKNSSNAIFITIQSNNTIEMKIKFLELFLKNGFNINAMNKFFLTPLIVSIYENSYQICHFLLKKGANPNYYGPENNDHPLTIAIIRQDDATINLLLKYHTKIDIPDKYLKTPVHHAFCAPNNISSKIKRFLLAKIRNINKTDNRMDSILNLLIHHDDWKKYMDILEEKKLKIYLKNKDDVSPIDGIISGEMDAFMELVYRSYLNQLDSGIEWVDNIDKKISILLENGEDIYSYKDYIMGKIRRGQSYPSKKYGQIIKLINPPQSNISHFSAYTYNYICFLYHILEKYPKIKIPGMAKDQMKNKTLKDFYKELTIDYQEKNSDNMIFRSIIRDYINHSPLLINHIIIWKNNKIYFISPYIVQGIHETLDKYPETEFIIFKITIISNKSFNHANLVIYDVKNKYVERFDPYGNVPFYHSQQINILIESFFNEYFPGTKYLSPDGISFQIFSDENNKMNYVENDPNGFCIAWCLWYLEMRIKNKIISPKSLIKKTIQGINKSEDKFKDYIRNYANYLDTEKNKILDKANIPKKYWYRLNIPRDIYITYLKYSRNIFSKIV